MTWFSVAQFILMLFCNVPSGLRTGVAAAGGLCWASGAWRPPGCQSAVDCLFFMVCLWSCTSSSSSGVVVQLKEVIVLHLGSAWLCCHPLGEYLLGLLAMIKCSICSYQCGQARRTLRGNCFHPPGEGPVSFSVELGIAIAQLLSLGRRGVVFRCRPDSCFFSPVVVGLLGRWAGSVWTGGGGALKWSGGLWRYLSAIARSWKRGAGSAQFLLSGRDNRNRVGGRSDFYIKK